MNGQIPRPDDSRSEGTPKSRKTIFILAAAAVVLIVAAFLVIAAAVGIFIYANGRNSPPKRTFDKPANSSNVGTDQTPAGTDAVAKLIEDMKARPRVGRFKLDNIVPSRTDKAFKNSLGEITGVYSSDPGKDVTLLVASYENKGLAVIDFGRMLGAEGSRGARVVRKMEVKGKTISAAFEKGAKTTVAFCTWQQPEKLVYCYRISSDDASAIKEFQGSVDTANTQNSKK